VAAAQETEPRHTLRAISLLGVLVLAKAITLVLLPASVTFSLWAPIAYFWQDVLVVLVFFLLDARLKRPALAWTLYAAVAVYAAVNVPITRVLSSPLTWTLMRATGSALTDSITHYFTLPNIVSLALPLAAAVTLPWVLSGRRLVLGRMWVALALAIIALGPIAITRVETRGLHRNALGALVETSVPRVTAVRGTADWRASPFGSAAADDLSRFRGIARGRNVIVLSLESTAARYLGLYGSAKDPTPALTTLGRDGLVFDRAYAVYPESIKGLFATLCSRYPAFDTAPELYANVPCTSLAATLASAGYQTALFHSGRFDYLGMRSVIDNRGFGALKDAGHIGGQVHSSFGVDEASAVRRMLSWIDALDKRTPFFLMYMPIAGHHPYVSTTPGPFDSSTDFGRYLNALHDGDNAVGDLIRGLQERHLYERTLFVVFGDHGEAFGQHPGNFAHTLFIYEENIRVPYVIAAPGAIAAGLRVQRLASVVDTAPTVLDLVGLPVPAGYQGASLLEPASRMALFYTDYSLGWLGLADGCWKYLYEIEARRSRLFDVCSDPDESRDRSGEFPERLEAYRDRVEKWAATQKDAVVNAR
jgi:arylsulfatase A-like enzyme